MHSYTINQINQILKGEIIGHCTTEIIGAEQLVEATNAHISIIGSKKYEKFWATSKACVAIVNLDNNLEPGENRAFIKVKNADLAMSQVLEMFAPEPPIFHLNIHKSAIIDETASIGTNTFIGANCYIGPNVKIGDNTRIYPNVTILDETTIGSYTSIWSGAVIRERCYVGDYCIIHSNASIGADGFGFRPCPEKGLVKIPQIGNVVIGNHVEIGANTCVDRGKFSSTIIGDGCKIDNLVQIAHNCKLGKYCIIAGHSVLAGSVTFGNGVVMAGCSAVKEHKTIGDGAQIGGGSMVFGDLKAGESVLGFPAVDARETLKQWVFLKQLFKKSVQ